MAETTNAANAAAGAQEAAQAQASAQVQAAEGQQEGQQAQTFTLEEVRKLIQSEADKRVTQALARQKKDFERQQALNGLNDADRAIAERDQEIAQMREQLGELNAYKARAAVLQALSDAGLPAAFAEVITIDPDPDSGEVNAARVKALAETFQRAVEEGVKARLAGTRTPAAATEAPAMTREQYLRLSLNQKAALAQSDPETYRRMNE